MKVVSRKSSSSTTTPTIPNDVIFCEILPRLPVKSLLRSKAVCKDWYDIISTPQFIKTHLQLSLFSSPRFFTMNDQGYWCKFYTFTYNEGRSNRKEWVHLDSSAWTDELVHRNKYGIIGCCNGLVCLSAQDNKKHEDGTTTLSFIVWNPATQECCEISPPTKDGRLLCWGGFGHTLAQDDYKIVSIWSDSVWIFSLRGGQWKQIMGFPSYDSPMFKGVFVGDVLYCKVVSSLEETDANIISLNLVNEQFEEIPITNLPIANIVSISLYVIKGCLSVHSEVEPQDVWMLKKQDDWKSWEKVFRFPSKIIVNHKGITWDGKILADHWGKLVLVDPNCNSLTDYMESADCYCPDDFWDWPYGAETPQHVESLVSPFGAAQDDNGKKACV